MKGWDLRRDRRFALHSAPVDLELLDGDARLSGTAVEITDVEVIAAFLASLGNPDAPGDAELFRLEVTGASIITVTGDKLNVVSWTPGGGVTHIERT